MKFADGKNDVHCSFNLHILKMLEKYPYWDSDEKIDFGNLTRREFLQEMICLLAEKIEIDPCLIFMESYLGENALEYLANIN